MGHVSLRSSHNLPVREVTEILKQHSGDPQTNQTMTTNDNYEVAEDNGLLPEEKSFNITFTKADNRAIVHSDIASLTRRLLSHDQFEVERKRTAGDGTITAVTGTLPIGCLRINPNPRENGELWQILR
jgi:hypothetical protein